MSFDARLAEKKIELPQAMAPRVKIRPFVREGAESQGRWAQRFYRQAQELREAARPAPVAPVAAAPAAARPIGLSKRAETTTDDAPLSLSESFERHWPSDTTKV